MLVVSIALLFIGCANLALGIIHNSSFSAVLGVADIFIGVLAIQAFSRWK